VSIDLKRTEGQAAFIRLVAQADILFEGFRPGVAERLGIGPDDGLKRRPGWQAIALGDDFPPDCLLARMRPSWSFSTGAHIALKKGKLARHGQRG
jgi:hypothetical protein